MVNEKTLLLSWFFSVSILSLAILYGANYEPSIIILNIFIAPFSIIIYFLSKMMFALGRGEE